MKRIIIPTDLTVESLQLVEYAILNFPKTKLEVVLVCGFNRPDTWWGLIQFSSTREINKLTNESFAKAVSVFVREHSDSIKDLSIKLFTGSNSFAFRNFLEHLRVHAAIVPEGEFLHFNDPNCFDPTRFIKRNIPEVIDVPLEVDRLVKQPKFSISNLLNILEL